MALTYASAGSAVAASGASPTTIATTAALAVGDVLQLVMAYDNSGGGGSDPMNTGPTLTPASGSLSAVVSTQTGNNDTGAASAGLSARAVAFTVTGAIASGTNITVAWTGTIVVRAMLLIKISSNVGGTVTYRTNSGTGFNQAAVSAPLFSTPTIPAAGELALCWCGYEYGAAITGDSDTSAGTWGSVIQVNTGSTTSGMCVAVQGKVLTDGVVQSFGPTAATASDWILGSTHWTETLPPPAFSQTSYRVYADGTESGSTALAAQDDTWIADVSSGDINFGLRVRLQNTTANAGLSTDDFSLQYSKGAGWVTLAPSGQAVVYYNSANLTEGAATTNRLGAGTGSFSAGEVTKVGVVSDYAAVASNYTEFLYSLGLRAAFLANSDFISFRVMFNGAAVTLDVSPSISVIKIANVAATITTDWGGWTGAAVASVTAAVNITGYRFFNDDGLLTASTALAPDNTNVTLPDADMNMQLRFQVGNIATASAAPTLYLQRNINGGAWSFMSASTAVTSADSPNYGNGAAVTTSRIAGGVGTFGNGQACDGVGNYATSATIPANGYTEIVYTIKLIAADLAGGEVLGLRLTNASAVPISSLAPSVGIMVTTDRAATIASNWGGWTGAATATVINTPLITQAAYRFYGDGTEAGSVALVAQDTPLIADLTPGDVNVLLRMRLQSTKSGVNINPNTDWQLQYEVNASGTWVNVGDSVVAAFASASLTDAEATTNRLTGGTGTFQAGKVSEDTLLDNLGWTALNHVEMLYSITLKKAGLAGGDQLGFRVLPNGTNFLTYTSVPAIGINNGANWPATISSDCPGA